MAKNSSKKTVFSINEPFISKNFKRLRNIIEEKSVPVDAEIKSILSVRSNKSKSKYQPEPEDLQKISIENDFIIKILSNMEERDIPACLLN